jgi:dTDP-4-dehydrorhamnose reductase
LKRVLLLGRDGQIGWELQRALVPHFVVFPFSRLDLDLSRRSDIESAVRSVRPDTIINAAAYTAVDGAEQDEETAFAVNGLAPEILAAEARSRDALLVHYSTDYVFDGQKAGLYVEDDVANPLGVYAASKRAGEISIESSGCDFLIFRTSWVYGTRGRNFLLTMLRLANSKPELRVVNDQQGVPNWSRMIAQVTLAVLLKSGDRAHKQLGTYHLSSTGRVTWHGFAEAIVAIGSELGLCPNVPVVPIATADYPTPTSRPVNSSLSSARLQDTFDLRIPDWRACLRWSLEDLAATAATSSLLQRPSIRGSLDLQR